MDYHSYAKCDKNSVIEEISAAGPFGFEFSCNGQRMFAFDWVYTMKIGGQTKRLILTNVTCPIQMINGNF